MLRNNGITAEQFIKAAETGNLNTVLRYIAANANNIVDIDVILKSAADNGHPAVVSALIAIPGTFQQRLTRIGFNDDPPEDCGCSISPSEVMNDPITVSSGHAFDRTALRGWWQSQGGRETFTCPNTRKSLNKRELENKTDNDVQTDIEEFVKKQENLFVAGAEEKRKQLEEQQQFLAAASAGDLKIVEKYIATNRNDNSKFSITDASGRTPALCAAQNGRTAVLIAIFAIPATFQERLNRIAFNKTAIPENLKCRISGDIINDPIPTSSGHNYDRAKLTEEFSKRGNPETINCFFNSNDKINKSELAYNTAIRMKGRLESFVKEQENKIITEAEKNKIAIVVHLPPPLLLPPTSSFTALRGTSHASSRAVESKAESSSSSFCSSNHYISSILTNINIRELNGHVTQLDVEATDSIECIKLKWQDKRGIPQDSQRFIWKGHQLEDGRTLSDYNIRNNDQINVLSRPRGD